MQKPGATRRTWSAVLLAVAFVSSMLISAAPASAVTPPDPLVVPPAPPVLCDDPIWGVDGPCMEIPIGGTVMGDVKAHLIFWLPEGYSFAPGVPNGDARHMALAERLINDLSGSETYNILTQYHDSFPEYPSLAADPRRGYHPNRIRVEGTYVETRPFPRAPLSGVDIEAEITRAGAAMGWSLPPADDRRNDIFFVFTPVGVQTCLNAPGFPDLCSGGQFAGYHSDYELPIEGSTANCAGGFDSDQSAQRAYVYLPTLGAGGSTPYPNNAFVDPVLDVMWHELAETMSEPFNSGWDSASSNPNVRSVEIGDACNPRFMPDGYGPRGVDGGTVTLNGNRYLLQRIYSNAAEGCTLGFHGQFVNFRPLAAKTTASPPFSLTGDATSRLPVTYGASGPCTVSGAVVTVTGVGSCTLTASQAGDRPAGGFYHPATPVTQAFTITYAPVAVDTTAVPSGRVGTAYSAALHATPGVAPYSWVKQSGSLPPGVTLSVAGALSGKPTTAGTYSFVAQVTDSHSSPGTTTKTLTITVTPPLGFRITTTSLPDATLGVPYSKALAAASGVAPYKWKKLTKLPTGLKLNAATGVISGTPKKTRGTFSFTVQASYKTKAPKQPAVTHTATRTLSIRVT